MSDARKPTPGPWIHGNWLKAAEGGIDEAGWCEVWRAEADGGQSLPFVACKHQDEQANAALIAEAGTVHHETGLTPRQLVEQRDALLAEIEREYTALSDFQNEWHGRNTEAGQAKLCRLRALIAKATGRDEQDVQDDYGTRKHYAAKTAGSTS